MGLPRSSLSLSVSLPAAILAGDQRQKSLALGVDHQVFAKEHQETLLGGGAFKSQQPFHQVIIRSNGSVAQPPLRELIGKSTAGYNGEWTSQGPGQFQYSACGLIRMQANHHLTFQHIFPFLILISKRFEGCFHWHLTLFQWTVRHIFLALLVASNALALEPQALLPRDAPVLPGRRATVSIATGAAGVQHNAGDLALHAEFEGQFATATGDVQDAVL